MREVVVTVTARQWNLHLINVDNVHERAKKESTRQSLNNLEHQKHAILTCTNMTEAQV